MTKMKWAAEVTWSSKHSYLDWPPEYWDWQYVKQADEPTAFLLQVVPMPALSTSGGHIDGTTRGVWPTRTPWELHVQIWS